jgi:Zn-dependent protease/predicted transcriptional regulator
LIGGTIPVGRIAGIDVRLHWTWGIAASLIAIALATSVFPDEVPGFSNGTYYVMGVVTAVLFFASVLLHELGHSLQARREGLATRQITLWMLGGVSESSAPFESAGTEGRVALAGPAVSAVLGVALVAAGQVSALPDTVAAVLLWLGWTNLLLLAFNLLPALPLDGGRALLALLWRIRGSELRATREAAQISQVFSAALIALGVLAFLAGGGFSGIWLAFVGWFILASGRAERAFAETRAALAGVHAADVMTANPVTIAPAASAQDLIDLARRAGHSAYPVVDEQGDSLGFVSAPFAERVPARYRDSVTVRELLDQSPDPVSLDADADVSSALPAITGSPFHRAAVTRAGRLVGLVSLDDLTRAARLRSPTAA